MSISQRLQEHLSSKGVPYEVLSHHLTYSSSQTAQASHISGNAIAKAVVLKDDAGYMLAVLPASHHILFDELQRILGRDLTMAPEKETEALFSDCETGAFPAIGTAFGLGVVLDESLDEESDIYFEGGDHATLLHIAHDEFEKLMEGAIHARFTRHG